ncbi:MAG: DUF1064 domain-containing protein [Firmicutes bacterium]|nr:DUF1064 domain-containing protein [Candidatus Colivicinus equi]
MIGTKKNLYTRNKFHAVKTKIDGITFDSKKEANRYLELKLLERAKKISNLRLQVPYVLIEKSKYGQQIVYKADFVYFDEDAKETVIEDTKGYRTDVYKLKARMMKERYDIVIREI